MSLELEEKGLSKVKCSDNIHPPYMHSQGGVETRGDIILTPPDVISFVYTHDDVIAKAFLLKKLFNFR